MFQCVRVDFMKIRSHYQKWAHFRPDQRYCDRYFPASVRGNGGQVLYGFRPAAERQLYMNTEISQMDHKRPFFYYIVPGSFSC